MSDLWNQSPQSAQERAQSLQYIVSSTYRCGSSVDPQSAHTTSSVVSIVLSFSGWLFPVVYLMLSRQTMMRTSQDNSSVTTGNAGRSSSPDIFRQTRVG